MSGSPRRCLRARPPPACARTRGRRLRVADQRPAPAQPSWLRAALYPLRPDLRVARHLMRGRRVHAVLAAAADEVGRLFDPQVARTLRGSSLPSESTSASSAPTDARPGRAGCCARRGGSGARRWKCRRRTRSHLLPASSPVPTRRGQRGLARIQALPSPRRERPPQPSPPARARGDPPRLCGCSHPRARITTPRLHDRPTRIPRSRSRRALHSARLDDLRQASKRKRAAGAGHTSGSRRMKRISASSHIYAMTDVELIRAARTDPDAFAELTGGTSVPSMGSSGRVRRRRRVS